MSAVISSGAPASGPAADDPLTQAWRGLIVGGRDVIDAFDTAWQSAAPDSLARQSAVAGALTTYFVAWSDFVGLSAWMARRAPLPSPLPSRDGLEVLDQLRLITGELAALRLNPEAGDDDDLARLFDECMQLLMRHARKLELDALLPQVPVLLECSQVLRRTAEVHEIELLISGDDRFANTPPLWQGRIWDWLSAAYFVLDDRSRAEACELRAADLAREHNLRTLAFDLCKRPLRNALEDNRLADAAALLEAMRAHLDPASLAQSTEFWDMTGRLKLAQKEWSAAQDAYRRALAAAESGDLPHQRRIVLWSMSGAVHVAMEQEAEALDKYSRMVEVSTGMQREIMVAGLLMMRAWFDSRQARPGYRESLARAFHEAARLNLLRFLRPLPEHAARLCSAALRQNIEPEFARRVIAARGLKAPELATGEWPFPLRIFALGTLTVHIDGEPMPPQAKPAVKPMALLRLLAANDGEPLPVARVLSALWPDEDAANRSAFDMALGRLRKLLNGEEGLRVENGRLVADPQRIWFDTRHLARLCLQIETGADQTVGQLQRLADHLLAVYAAPFLQHEEEEPWLIAGRERQSQRFLRAVDALGRRLQEAQDRTAAISLYERAIEVEPLAESLYRRLMQCHAESGQAADAIRVYRRCRQMLSVMLGIPPSPETEALMRQIHGSGTP